MISSLYLKFIPLTASDLYNKIKYYYIDSGGESNSKVFILYIKKKEIFLEDITRDTL